jgi:predicted nuclease of predicted toxin-antitoxin system
MKFIIDAQLPQRLARRLEASGHEAVHTRDLPAGNRTGDAAINDLSLAELRVVVTKDGDFVDTFLLRHQPYKLLLVATGNITNRDLERILQENLEQIVAAFEQYDFIELGRTALICHM